MILPSFGEGWPVATITSFTLDPLVINSYVAGIPELVVPNELGQLIPAESVGFLVIAMKSFLETPISRLEEMGIIGAKRVAQQHNVTQEAQKLHQFFESVYLSSSLLIFFINFIVSCFFNLVYSLLLSIFRILCCSGLEIL